MVVRFATKSNFRDYPKSSMLNGMVVYFTFCNEGRFDWTHQLASFGTFYDGRGWLAREPFQSGRDPTIPLDEKTSSGEYVYTTYFDISWQKQFPSPGEFANGWIVYDLSSEPRDVCMRLGDYNRSLLITTLSSYSNVAIISKEMITQALQPTPNQ